MELSSVSFSIDQFNSENIPNEFNHQNDSAKNPFLDSDSPKKNSSKLFQKPAEMFMATKLNRYDVFKNNDQDETNDEKEKEKPKTETSQDPFKDFAIAAFSEFKIDKSSSSNSLIHEFSNKLFQNGHQQDYQQQQQSKNNPTKVIIHQKKRKKQKYVWPLTITKKITNV